MRFSKNHFFRMMQVILKNLLDEFFWNFNDIFYFSICIVGTKIIYVDINYYIFKPFFTGKKSWKSIPKVWMSVTLLFSNIWTLF